MTDARGVLPEARERAASHAPARDAYLDVRGLRLHVRMRGAAGAPPVVVLHGITGHAREFDGIAAALADRYRVVAVDQRGHGASDWADAYDPHGMADDVAAVVDALGLDRVRVVGHSMGGANGWWLASRRPDLVERLAILDMTPTALAAAPASERMLRYLRASAAARFATAADGVRAYVGGNATDAPEHLVRFARDNLVLRADGRWAWRFDGAGLAMWVEDVASSEAAQWERLGSVRCPTLVVRAGRSAYTTLDQAARMARALRNGQHAEVQGAGHDVHFDRPDALVRILRAFLA